MYEYKCELIRIIDGDTVVFDIDLGFKIWIRDEHVRFARVNAPESRTRDLEEKALGLASKDFVIKTLDEAEEIRLKTYKDFGKYGRFIADIMVMIDGDWKCLNDMLVESGHAKYVDY